MIMWHSLLLAFIGHTAEGIMINLDNVWELSIRKFADLAMATAHRADIQRMRHISRGEEPPEEFRTLQSQLSPLGEITEWAEIRWSKRFAAELQDLGLLGYLTPINEKKKIAKEIIFVKGH